jgi:ribosome biogenesis GTPase
MNADRRNTPLLEDYGWGPARQLEFTHLSAPGLVAGRVVVQHRGRYLLATAAGEATAALAGSLVRDAGPGGFPAAGDWVAAVPAPGDGPALIRHVLVRRSAFTRRSPEGRIQVVAANIELAFVVAPLSPELNLRRLERYLAQAWASGAQPIVLLTKVDLDSDPAEALALARRSAPGTELVAVSAVTGEGLEAARAFLAPGRTAVLVGPSGAGKSTLVNALAGGARMTVGEVRADDGRGRHTTTHRELILLPGGGLLLDTPGMRELALDDADEGVEAAFDDIAELATRCRFRNCQHDGEPGCAVRAALEAGELDEGRWRSFAKLVREAAHQARLEDPLLREASRRRWITLHKAARARMKFKEGRS